MAPLSPRLLVVPQDEPDRSVGLHVRAAEDACELHHERRSRTVVVRRLVVAVAVHVRADDVHLFRVRGADLRAENFLARPGLVRLHVRLPDRLVWLGVGIHVDAGARPGAEDDAASLAVPRVRRPCATPASLRGRRVDLPPRVFILDALGVRAAVALELRLDPVDGGTVARRALAPIAELRQALDRRLVLLEVEPLDQGLDRGIGRRRRRNGRALGGRSRFLAVRRRRDDTRQTGRQ